MSDYERHMDEVFRRQREQEARLDKLLADEARKRAIALTPRPMHATPRKPLTGRERLEAAFRAEHGREPDETERAELDRLSEMATRVLAAQASLYPDATELRAEARKQAKNAEVAQHYLTVEQRRVLGGITGLEDDR